jgi:hypothetical protein
MCSYIEKVKLMGVFEVRGGGGVRERHEFRENCSCFLINHGSKLVQLYNWFGNLKVTPLSISFNFSLIK